MESKIDKKKYFGLFNKLKEDVVSENNIKKIFIVDGLNLFIRNYTVNPIVNDDGIHVGGIIGFIISLVNAMKLINPHEIIIVFDGKGGSVKRRALYPDYKANRRSKRILRPDISTTQEEDEKCQQRQIGRLLDYLEILPVSIVCVDNIEADDSIAYLVTNVFNHENERCYIMSTDCDFLQLVNDNVRIWSPIKKTMFDKEKIKESYQINSNNFLLYRILTGDSSGYNFINVLIPIPGTPGILSELLKENKYNADYIISKAEENENVAKAFKSIKENAEQIKLNEKLMQLNDVDISAHSKNAIENHLSKSNKKLDKIQFLKYLVEDKITLNKIPDVNLWIHSTFSKLEYYNTHK